MGSYIRLTRLSPETLKSPESVGDLNKKAEERIKKECPGVKWLANYAVLGPCDYVDIFAAPDSEAATETWVATPWDRFLSLATSLKT